MERGSAHSQPQQTGRNKGKFFKRVEDTGQSLAPDTKWAMWEHGQRLAPVIVGPLVGEVRRRIGRQTVGREEQRNRQRTEPKHRKGTSQSRAVHCPKSQKYFGQSVSSRNSHQQKRIVSSIYFCAPGSSSMRLPSTVARCSAPKPRIVSTHMVHQQSKATPPCDGQFRRIV